MNLKIYSHLQKQIPFLLYQNFNNENCLVISFDKLNFNLNFLKNHIGLQFNILSCISGVDYLQENYLIRKKMVFDLMFLLKRKNHL